MKIELFCGEVYPIYTIEKITEHCPLDCICDVPSDLLKKWVKGLKDFQDLQLEIVRYLNIPLDKNDITQLTDLNLEDIAQLTDLNLEDIEEG
jgi:hypothetical protein